MSKLTEKERMDAFVAFAPEVQHLTCWLKDMGYFNVPASIDHHGCHRGGLFDHSMETAKALVALTDGMKLRWFRKESPKIVGLFHDLCKCDRYVCYEDGTYALRKTPDILPEHGAKSVILTLKHLPLTDEEIACIRWHMGAYETDTKLWNSYGEAVKRYPNVLYTHTADMIASKIKRV